MKRNSSATDVGEIYAADEEKEEKKKASFVIVVIVVVCVERLGLQQPKKKSFRLNKLKWRIGGTHCGRLRSQQAIQRKHQ